MGASDAIEGSAAAADSDAADDAAGSSDEELLHAARVRAAATATAAMVSFFIVGLHKVGCAFSSTLTRVGETRILRSPFVHVT
jgi:hypothetical protein